MTTTPKNPYFFQGIIIAVLLTGVDQWSKSYIFSLLDEHYSSFIEVTSFFNLVKVYNYGVSFGLLNDIIYGPIILTIVTIMIALGLCLWLYRVHNWYMTIALAAIIGGAFGNIIDRILTDAVADFLDFHWLEYHWPAFNIADSTIFIGVAMILIEPLIYPEERHHEENNP